MVVESEHICGRVPCLGVCVRARAVCACGVQVAQREPNSRVVHVHRQMTIDAWRHESSVLAARPS